MVGVEDGGSERGEGARERHVVEEERAALRHIWETLDTRSRVYPSRCLAISKASSGGR